MTQQSINASLRAAVIGWAFMGLLGIPLAVYFDLLEGWRWPPYNAIYDQMIVSIYFAVGICSAIAIKNPTKHISFLWFVAISSFTHGGVMFYHAAINPHHVGHLIGDVWILAGGVSLAIPLWRLGRFQDWGDAK
jgi:FtsH-binding integral membrane protein